MSHMHNYENGDMDYSAEYSKRSEPVRAGKTRRPEHGRRRGKTPQSVNGIHRRRNRKMAW